MDRPSFVAPDIPYTHLLDGVPVVKVLVVGFVLLLVVSAVYALLTTRSDSVASVAGGLNYVVGPMGSGKSMFGVRRIVGALCEGSYAVTNVRLLDGWEYAVIAKLFPRDKRNPDKRERRAAWLRSWYVYEPSLKQAMRYRLPCVECGGSPRDCGHAQTGGESRAVVVWDETHNDLNNRDYQGVGLTAGEKESSREHRRQVVKWATQLRKLGYVGYLLSQHQENTDAQLRRVCNHVIKLQNQRSRSKYGKLVPARFTMFLAYWYPAHAADGTTRIQAARFERYLLPWHRSLYDSWEIFHGLDDDLADDATPIVLPSQGRGAGSPATRPAALGASVEPSDPPTILEAL